MQHFQVDRENELLCILWFCICCSSRATRFVCSIYSFIARNTWPASKVFPSLGENEDVSRECGHYQHQWQWCVAAATALFAPSWPYLMLWLTRISSCRVLDWHSNSNQKWESKSNKEEEKYMMNVFVLLFFFFFWEDRNQGKKPSLTQANVFLLLLQFELTRNKKKMLDTYQNAIRYAILHVRAGSHVENASVCDRLLFNLSLSSSLSVSLSLSISLSLPFSLYSFLSLYPCGPTKYRDKCVKSCYHFIMWKCVYSVVRYMCICGGCELNARLHARKMIFFYYLLL